MLGLHTVCQLSSVFRPDMLINGLQSVCQLSSVFRPDMLINGTTYIQTAQLSVQT